MIDVYKIGRGFCYAGTDKNGGLFEFDLIAKEAEEISRLTKVDCLIIVGGNLSIEENEKLSSLINTKKNLGVKIIFVLTDSVSLSDLSKGLIAKCDLLLHQAYGYKFDIDIEQQYSFVPELFYKDDIPIPYLQHDSVFFGGSDYNREDKVKEYFRDGRCPKNKTFSLIKINGIHEDERIDYSSFQKLMSKFKYSLMICRKEYRGDVSWFTPRFIEAVSNWSLPFVDFEYSKNRPYTIPLFDNEVSSYDELMEKIDMIDEIDRLYYLITLRAKINNNKGKFRELVLNFLENKK